MSTPTNVIPSTAVPTPPAGGISVLDQLLAGKGAAVPASAAAVSASGAAPTLPAGLAALAPPVATNMITVTTASAPAAPVVGGLAAILGAGATAPAVSQVSGPPIVHSMGGGLAALLGKPTISAPAVAPAVALAPAAPAVPHEAFQAAAVAAGYPADFSPQAGISPPDAPLPTSTVEEVAAANVVEETDGEPEEGAAESTPAIAGAAPEADGAKTKRKRRTKAEMEAARAAEAAKAAGAPETVSTGAAPPIEAARVEAVAVVASPAGQTAIGALAALLSAPAAPAVEAAPPESHPAVPVEVAALANDCVSTPPVDQVMEQIKGRLNTPDARFACPVKYLFIDCMPGKGWPGEQPRDLAEFMHAFAGLAAQNAGQADYRMIRYESKGYLGASIRALMRGLPVSIYVDTRTPDAHEFISNVLPYTELVIRGLR